MITDFHTHAFPDSLAERAIRALEAETDEAKAKLDGRVSSLLASMDRAGIGRAVVCSIATKPAQFESILEWSRHIASDRIIPFPSVHPQDPDALERISGVAEAGLKGLKLHAYYQDCYIDDAGMFPQYERMAERGLILVCHTGFDMAFSRLRRADPVKIVNIMNRVPDLKLVVSHLGAWQDWDEVERHILGKPIYMEISYSLQFLSRERARSMLRAHPAEYVLFGTDSPWDDQTVALQRLRSLDLGRELEDAILSTNASRLLDV